MAEPKPEDEFSGNLQVRCDHETYAAFFTLADEYYNYEHALRDLLRVAEENPHALRVGVGELDLGMADDGQTEAPRWG